jgi:hypothetical protein
MSEDWKFVPPEEMQLRSYPCGVSTGDCLRLLKELVIRDHRNRPTGKKHSAGEIWTVLSGHPDEPDVIWLQQPDGERHIWDAMDMLQWFEITQST